MGLKNPERTILFIDHASPSPRKELSNTHTVLREFSKEYGLNLVATNDCHYLNKEDYDFHEILLCIQTRTTMSDENRMSFKVNEF